MDRATNTEDFQSRKLGIFFTEAWENGVVRISKGTSLLMNKAFTLATQCKELTQWKRSWCWERLKAGGEGDNRGWDGWMASLIQCTWIWASSGTWWRTGKPGMLQSKGLQNVGHDWATTNTLHSLWTTTNTLHSLKKYLLSITSEIAYHRVYIQSWT